MSDLEYTPVMVEQQLRRLLNNLSAATKAQDEAYGRFLDAKRALDFAEASAFVETVGKGSVKDREALVALATVHDREACDVADRAYRYARSRLEMLKIQIMGVQTIGKSVSTAYGAVGVVES